MLSGFNSLSNLPKPFGLFTNNKNDKNYKDRDVEDDIDKTKLNSNTIIEGLDTKEPQNPKKTDDTKTSQSKFIVFLVAIFFILFVIVGLTYYFNSNLLMMKQLMMEPFYTKNDFWQRFKGNMVASKITIFILLWAVVFCMNLLLMDMVFKNNEYANIFYVTTIFYWSIVGSTMLLIGNIPSLVDVFENTIGYSLLSSPLFNLKKTISMFKNRNFKSNTIKIPYDFLITTFNIPSFHDHFDELCAQYPNNEEYKGAAPINITDKPKSDFYIDLHTWLITDENQLRELNGEGRPNENKTVDARDSLYARQELLKCIVTKNTVGHFVWILLASYVTVLLTMNTIIQ